MTRIEPDHKRLAPAVYRAVQVLDLLGRESSLTLTEIQAATGLPKSSLFNLLTALTSTGLVEKDDVGGRYALGLRILTLAAGVHSRLDVRKVALTGLQRLTDETLETTHLAVLEQQSLDVIYIEKMDSPHAVKLASHVGRKVPSYCTALGKALLSGLPDTKLREQLREIPRHPMTAHTITDLEELIVDLQQVRVQGYAVDDEEHEQGVRCLAAPIRSMRGEVVAAVSIAGPTNRISPNRLEELAPLLCEVAGDISRRLGFAGSP